MSCKTITFPGEVRRFDDLERYLGNYWAQKHGKLPSFFSPMHLKHKGTLDKIKDAGYQVIARDVFTNITSELIFEKDDVIISVTHRDKDYRWPKRFEASVFCPTEKIEEIETFLKTTIGYVRATRVVPNEDPQFSIGLLLPSMSGLDVRYFNIDYDEVPMDNYSKGVRDGYDAMLNKLNTSKKGLYLLTGEPGTGKTTLLRKLAYDCDRSFIFINADNAELLGNPMLVATLMHYTGTVLVIEDGESSIASRADNKERSKFTSNLLNITDGLMSDLLQVQVIVTLNFAKENIDSAFRRAGRLQLEQEFEALSIDEANTWLKKHKSDVTVTEPKKLCDLYELITKK